MTPLHPLIGTCEARIDNGELVRGEGVEAWAFLYEMYITGGGGGIKYLQKHDICYI